MIKKCTLDKSLCTKMCSLVTLKLLMYQKQSRQTAGVDGCDEFNDILTEMANVDTQDGLDWMCDAQPLSPLSVSSPRCTKLTR